MRIVEVIFNDNPDLIRALRDEGLLSSEPILETGVCGAGVSLYEGKDNWFFEIWVEDNPMEIIVPKTVDRDTAMNMALYLMGGEREDEIKEICKLEYENQKHWCEQQFKSDIKLYGYEDAKLEYETCLDEAKEDYEICLEEAKECENDVREIERELRGVGWIPLGCKKGEEIGSPDIGFVCSFIKRKLI